MRVCISVSVRCGWFQRSFRKSLREIFMHSARKSAPEMLLARYVQSSSSCLMAPGAEGRDVCELQHLFNYIAFSTNKEMEKSSHSLCRTKKFSFKKTILRYIVPCNLVVQMFQSSLLPPSSGRCFTGTLS